MTAEYDFWTKPVDPVTGRCQQDGCCKICGNGDPTPESGQGAIPSDPDEDGHLAFQPAFGDIDLGCGIP